jgi:superfamily II DNA/RNA helicase
MQDFAALGLSPFFIERLSQRSIRSPTAVQALIIPRLQGEDNVLFRSATGTGKTFAYLLPLFRRFFEAPAEGTAAPQPASPPAILICAPTYELCSQIKGEADFLLEGAGVKTALLIGSAPLSRQIEGLKKNKPRVAVGNPARLLQLARMGKLSLRGIRTLVLDEWDRLLAEELFADTAALAELLPGEVRAIACSATMPVKNRDKLFALRPEGAWTVLEETSEEPFRTNIDHWAIFSEDRKKIAALRSFIAAVDPKNRKHSLKCLIFTARTWDVGKIVSQLQFHHLAVSGLYGDMDKKRRKAAIDDFRSGRSRFLVSSDLSARGLDIGGVSHIIALDVPATGDAYIHRAGRTARAGGRGIMVTIGTEQELRRLAALEKRLGIVIYPKELYGGRVAAPLAEPGD